jgi:hypothetical protein
LNIGNAESSQSEYNVQLDPQAYIGLLRSGLPLYLCFCLPMQREGSNALSSTWWRFRQSEVLPWAPRELQNYFTYALQKCAPEELDPLKAPPGVGDGPQHVVHGFLSSCGRPGRPESQWRLDCYATGSG